MEAALDQWEQSFTVKHKQWLMLLELLEVHGSEKSESAVGGNIDWSLQHAGGKALAALGAGIDMNN